MKVEGLQGTKKFSDLIHGDAFLWGGTLHLKMDMITIVEGDRGNDAPRSNYNALSLHNTGLYQVTEGEEIIPISAKVVIG